MMWVVQPSISAFRVLFAPMLARCLGPAGAVASQVSAASPTESRARPAEVIS